MNQKMKERDTRQEPAAETKQGQEDELESFDADYIAECMSSDDEQQ